MILCECFMMNGLEGGGDYITFTISYYYCTNFVLYISGIILLRLQNHHCAPISIICKATSLGTLCFPRTVTRNVFL